MSYKLRLTTEETYILADKMKAITQKKLSRRLLAISLRHFGYKVKDISLIIGASEKTITTWIKKFINGGFDELLDMQYPKDRNSKLAPYQDVIRSYRAENSESSLESLQEFLSAEHGVDVEYSWLYRYVTLHEL